MFDVRTFGLLGLAVAAPTLLEQASARGVPIPVYITAGQKAALASYGAPTSGDANDTQQFLALLFAGIGKMPALSGSQAADIAQRLLAACDAGAAAATEPYTLNEELTGFAGLFAGEGKTVTNPYARSALGKAYDTVKSMTLFAPDDEDVSGLAPALQDLAQEMDGQGFLVTGKPQTVTMAGGVAAAGAASAKFVAAAGAGAVGAAAAAALELLFTSPVLLGIAALVVWRATR